ncbi:MAG TPA: hypothetical protein VHL11_07340 [Phototrophicaceae bacterium]|jgi:hypothetical protein|nr:hypothetical protein [Phototrophicaceae bacterium]
MTIMRQSINHLPQLQTQPQRPLHSLTFAAVPPTFFFSAATAAVTAV